MSNPSFVGMRFREWLFILTTFPIAVIAFWVVRQVLFGGGFLPIMILLMLVLLTFAQVFGAFEIRRTNWALKTNFIGPIRPWFASGFWTWDGVKERITSINSWFVLLYVFIAAFLSSLGITLMVSVGLGLFILVFATRLVTIDSWSASYGIFEQDVNGQLRLQIHDNVLRIFFLDFKSGKIPVTHYVSWDLTSGWTVLATFGFILSGIIFVPILARQLRNFVEKLLGDSGLDQISREKIAQRQEKRK